jgi:hypothetical protein
MSLLQRAEPVGERVQDGIARHTRQPGHQKRVHVHSQLGDHEGRLQGLLVRPHLGKHLLVQGRGGAREEVHVAVGRAQAEGYRAGVHVQEAHVRFVQSGRQERLQGRCAPTSDRFALNAFVFQGLQTVGIELRDLGRGGFVEGILPESRCVS